jgi:hypothetical protein
MSTPQYVRYDLTPKDFSQTGTFTLGYSEFAPLPYYPGDHLCLMYDYFMLNATTAHEFKIHFATQQGIPIHFLILNAEQFNEFNHTNCVDRPFGWELHVLAPTSDQDWVVPERGEYVLLFFSRHFLGGRIYLSVQAYGQAMQVSTSAYTKTNFIELLSTQTITSTLPNVTPPTDNFAFILPVIIIGLVLVAGTVILKRHTKSLWAHIG